MDSNSGTEKSLPGMGIPRWMKKSTERYNYSDICASPPSNEDGFIHINRHRLQQASSTVTNTASTDASSSNVECFQNSRKKTGLRTDTASDMVAAAGETTSSIMLANKQDCKAALKETSSFYKSIVTTTSSSLVNLAMASQEAFMTTPSTLGSEITSQVSLLSKVKPTAAEFEAQTASMKLTDMDSAVTQPNIIVSKARKNGAKLSASASMSQIYVEKGSGGLHPPQDDSTPLSTPTDTPNCSPQIVRRGNPFFTTSEKSGNSVNWLFRPSVKADAGRESKDNLYETRIDMGRTSSSSPSSPSTAQKVRYVPKPSELRELNFWSPTSM